MYTTCFAIWAYGDAESVKRMIMDRFEELSDTDIEVSGNVIWFQTDYNPFDENKAGKTFADKLKSKHPSIGLYMTAEHNDIDLIFCAWCAHEDKKLHSTTVTDAATLESAIDYSWSCADIIDQIEKDPSREPSFLDVEFDDEDEFDDEF